MLPASARMRSSAAFDQAVRGGVRCGRPTVVVHARVTAGENGAKAPAQVGFIVSKKVGNAVTRNRVKRRLRHLVRAELPGTADGALVVVRALPASATEPTRLAADLSAAWHSCLGRLAVGR
ncbi:ribonuclease P protein component [Brooklawnia cerclae]|uniref:ribonuclease P protein component n=1 Tax=Brooklawnia cerclae TaxID=349934 RepID=UPI0014246A79